MVHSLSLTIYERDRKAVREARGGGERERRERERRGDRKGGD